MVSAMAGVQKPHWTAAWRVNASAMRSNAGSLPEALDGQHLATVRLDGEVGAGAHRQPVDEHGAGAAHLHVAGALGAREAQPVAQHVEQQLLGLDVDGRALRR